MMELLRPVNFLKEKKTVKGYIDKVEIGSNPPRQGLGAVSCGVPRVGLRGAQIQHTCRGGVC